MRKILTSLLVLLSITCNAQITINIRYNAPDGNALKYMREMETTGYADSIRAIPGCIEPLSQFCGHEKGRGLERKIQD